MCLIAYVPLGGVCDSPNYETSLYTDILCTQHRNDTVFSLSFAMASCQDLQNYI